MLLHCFSLLFIAFAYLVATSVLPDNQLYSFEKTGIHAFALLFIAFAYIGATSVLRDNQPYSFEKTGSQG